MTEAKLVLLRHGQTKDNLDHVDTGQNDVPLTAEGRKQASMAGLMIGNIHFDKVYSSPLSRAYDTALLALESSGKQKHLLNGDGTWKVEKRKEIIEVDDGDLTGRHMDDPDVVEYFKKAVFDKAPPNGESEKHFVARVRKFYDEAVVPRLERGENVLIVAHTGTLRALYIAMGITPQPEDGQPWKNRRRVYNAIPVINEYKDGVLAKSGVDEADEALKKNTPQQKKPSAKKTGDPRP